MSIIKKTLEAVENGLDLFNKNAELHKANMQHEMSPRKGYIEVDTPQNTAGLFKEKQSMAGPMVLKNMARKNSLIIAIHQCLINQVSNFTQPQKDKYSPGFVLRPRNPADMTREEKMQLANPELNEEEYAALKYDLEQKKMKLQEEQSAKINKIKNFLLHCGSNILDTDTTYKRSDFDRFIKLVARDRLTYNYGAIELIPNKGKDSIGAFYAVSAGTIRYVAASSLKQYKETVRPALRDTLGPTYELNDSEEKPFRYLQLIRGRPVAAWTEDELIFEAANPTVDPEDYGYAQGELEWLINTVTSHLYAEAHNRNFFTQGIGSKGILHIKGDNISRAQLEGFKRSWLNQLSNSRNAFRPPVIGMADEVKWVELSQSNREMEFSNWMEYLIKIACAIYQIDPAEINFDIAKTSTSTLNESNSEQRIKSSKNKGLRPLLMYLQNIINNQILPRWNKELADEFVFEFVGLDAETKMEEVDRLEKEGRVYKTLNEIRTEQGLPPVEDGDIVMNAIYSQYLAAKEQRDIEQEQGGAPGEEDISQQEDSTDSTEDTDDISSEIDDIISSLQEDDSQEEQEDTKKALTIEYHHFKEDD